MIYHGTIMKTNPNVIQGHLRIAGTNQARLARELRVNPAWVSLVINGKGKSRRVQDAITEKIGFNPWDSIESAGDGTAD